MPDERPKELTLDSTWRENPCRRWENRGRETVYRPGRSARFSRQMVSDHGRHSWFKRQQITHRGRCLICLPIKTIKQHKTTTYYCRAAAGLWNCQLSTSGIYCGCHLDDGYSLPDARVIRPAGFALQGLPCSTSLPKDFGRSAWTVTIFLPTCSSANENRTPWPYRLAGKLYNGGPAICCTRHRTIRPRYLPNPFTTNALDDSETSCRASRRRGRHSTCIVADP